MSGWGDVLVGLASGTVGTGGVGTAALLLVRANRRKTGADTELVIQQAAAQAVKTVHEAAEETRRELKEAREENKGLRSETGQLREDLRQARDDLLQARKEMEELRSQASAERQQLLEQMGTERAEHAAAMTALRKEVAAGQMRRLSNGIGTILGEEFRDVSGL